LAKVKIIGTIPDDTTLKTKFDNIPSTTLYKLGDYRIETNVDRRKIIDYSFKINLFSKEYTLEKLEINKTISEKLYNLSNVFNLNANYNDISLNSNFGSLFQKFEYTVFNIINKFPFSLYVENNINDVLYNTAVNITFDANTNRTTFQVPTIVIGNKGRLVVDSGNFTQNTKNFNVNKNSYSIRLDDNKNIEYKVFDFIGNINTDNFLTFVVEGKPFNTTTVSKKFHIKPNEIKYYEFINDLTDLEKYFLSNKKDDKYVINFKKPVYVSDNITTVDTFVEWTFSDGYNIDVTGLVFKKFIDDIMNIAILYDEYKTDVIYRMYTPSSLKEFDRTENSKISILTRIYGETFDNIKQYIDGLTKLNVIGYDKKDSVPDILVKNLAKVLGWEYRDLLDENSLLENLFKYTQSDVSESKIPAEINIELWRRIINNTVYLFKSKGTRNSIYTFFRMIGIPDEFINLNEYVYQIEAPINLSTFLTQSNVVINESEVDNQNTVDDDGYPVVKFESNNYYFQLSGNTDFGQTYLNRFRNDGFKFERITDNKKSWVYTETTTERESENTYYNINNSREIINTKEISVGLNPSNAEIYKIYLDTESQNISFGKYLDKILREYIDVKNRKIITDNNGGIYPKLSKIYFDYLKNINNNLTYINLLNFVKKFDKYFINFIQQLIPATVIYRGLGVISGNGQYIKQKHRYIRGINDGSVFTGSTEFFTCETFNIDAINITNARGNIKGSVEVIVSGGNGLYLYSIDGINFDNNNIFTNLAANIDNLYTIYVKDSIGCLQERSFRIENECDILLTNIDITMNIPVIVEFEPEITPTTPIAPTPTPRPPIVERVCPVGLVDTIWAGPYVSSNQACQLAPTDISLGNSVKLYINENAVVGNQIDTQQITTAWINCFTMKPNSAVSGYYSNGSEWIYVSNTVSQIGTNVSGGNTCQIDNIII